MKAVLCKKYGPPPGSVVVEDIPTPEPKPGEALVEIHAAGVNFPDVLMLEDKYQFKPPLPFSPGGEVAGVVSAVGEGCTRVKTGDRVVGSCGFGGYAEAVAIEEARLIPVPDGMDMTTASGFVMTYGTSYHALKDRAQLKEDETLLVLGAAGGVGLAAVQLGKLMGARVIAAASSEAKCKVARDEGGADEVLVYPAGEMDREAQKAFSNEIKALTGGTGVDVIYDPVGGSYSEPALRAIAWEGRFLVVGFAAGPIPRMPLNLTLLKVCQIVGVFWGAFTARHPDRNKANLDALGGFVRAGKIKPYISKTYPLEEAGAALDAMNRRAVSGKIVIVPSR